MLRPVLVFSLCVFSFSAVSQETFNSNDTLSCIKKLEACYDITNDACNSLDSTFKWNSSKMKMLNEYLEALNTVCLNDSIFLELHYDEWITELKDSYVSLRQKDFESEPVRLNYFKELNEKLRKIRQSILYFEIDQKIKQLSLVIKSANTKLESIESLNEALKIELIQADSTLDSLTARSSRSFEILVIIRNTLNEIETISETLKKKSISVDSLLKAKSTRLDSMDSAIGNNNVSITKLDSIANSHDSRLVALQDSVSINSKRYKVLEDKAKTRTWIGAVTAVVLTAAIIISHVDDNSDP